MRIACCDNKYASEEASDCGKNTAGKNGNQSEFFLHRQTRTPHHLTKVSKDTSHMILEISGLTVNGINIRYISVETFKTIRVYIAGNE